MKFIIIFKICFSNLSIPGSTTEILFLYLKFFINKSFVFLEVTINLFIFLKFAFSSL